jgi:hypothetical protein
LGGVVGQSSQASWCSILSSLLSMACFQPSELGPLTAFLKDLGSSEVRWVYLIGFT